ncbi:uncharacterized protein Dvar_80680 [Desulfosarcina variabilis str. Montpellier]|uniref:hypothetical protein n=1 Tax=Desulfosarcina variabilis TaxID=2300 RepID=UPI003AFA6EE4
MKHIILLFSGIFLASCSFKSVISTKVEVYGGPTLPVCAVTDARKIISASSGIGRDIQEYHNALKNQPEKLKKIPNTYRATIQAYGEYLSQLAGEILFKDAAKSYKSKWYQAVKSIEAALKKEGDTKKHPDILTKQLESIESWLYSSNSRGKTILNGVDIEPFIFKIIRKKIINTGDNGKESEKILSALREAVLQKDKLGTKSKSEVILKSVKKDDFKKLEKVLSELKLADEDLTISDESMTAYMEIDESVNPILQKVNDAVSTSDKIQLEALFGSVISAVDGLNSEAMKLMTTQNDVKEMNQLEIFSKNAALKNSVDRYVAKIDEVYQPVRKLETEYINSLKNQLNNLENNPKNPYSSLSVKLPDHILKEIAATNQIKPEQIGRLELEKRVADFSKQIVMLTEGPETFREQTNNLVSLIKTAPFMITDPNIKEITSEVDESGKDMWQPKPIDNLVVEGGGDAQYIIVQDSPKNFRLKKLSVDPSKVIDLKLSIADAAVEVLGSVALSAAGMYGIPVPEAGPNQNQPNEIPLSGTSVREQELIIKEEADISFQGLKVSLQNILNQIPSDGLSDNISAEMKSRLKGILKGYQTELQAILDSSLLIKFSEISENIEEIKD